MNRWYPRNLRGARTEFMRKRWLETELPKAAQHEEDVREAREAREARQASGYHVRWRVAWAQAVGWLVVVAIVGGLFLLLLHTRGAL